MGLGLSYCYRQRHHLWNTINVGVMTSRPFSIGLINRFLTTAHDGYDQVRRQLNEPMH